MPAKATTMERYWSRYAELGFRSPERFEYSKRQTLHGVDLNGKRVLDIGCGDGMKGIYLALLTGASEWVAVDEYEGAGSDPENLQRFQENMAKIEPHSVRQEITSFQDNQFETASFDAIVAIDVCHHFIEIENRIKKGNPTFEAFRPFFAEFVRVLKPGGVLILRDLSRHHVSELLPINRMPVVWETKHDASEWALLLEDVGFGRIDWHYYVPYQLRKYQVALANSVMNYFLKARYTIVARTKQLGN